MPSSSWIPDRRRLLQALGAASGGAALASLGAAQQDQDQEQGLVVEQADQCIPVTPLRGSEPVEALYDYTYPSRFHGPPGSDGTSFSSAGTTDLQRDRTSLLFLYEGPEGLSLVVVHGHLDGDTDAGATITFEFHGLPADGQWIVRDDYYVDEAGRKPESNFDRWNVGGDVHTVDWAYRAARTDGAAFRGLGTDLHVRIEPAFNDAASLAGDHDHGPIESWELLSGDLAAPERHPLALDRPVVIRRGTCEGTADAQAQDGGTAETKHERKQRKHERKAEKKQEKHRRKQRKHERKEEKKQRKHERKQQKHDDDDGDEEEDDEDD